VSVRDDIPVYHLPSDALRRPWVSRRFLDLIIAHRLAPRRRLAFTVAPAIASVLAHALLIGSVIYGADQPRTTHMRSESGPGSSSILSADEPVMTLILINEPSPAPPKEVPIPLASRGFAPPDLPITLISPNANLAFDAQDAAAETATDSPSVDEASETALRGLLFGRYVGQIRARIERAWMRPRTPIGASSFYCVVQIAQDRHGNVKETALQQCNGDLRWQLSLVQAIQTASPLPAPPDPKVFADAVTLKFEARAFGPSSDVRDYEPPAFVAKAVSQAQRSNAQLSRFAGQLHSAHGPSSAPIELTITGTPAAPQAQSHSQR
jgi:hypothetical protein